MNKQTYDIAIVGGGITGASTLYLLSHYTDVQNIILFEKYSQGGEGVSHHSNNSQTLHFGDIETNYKPEKSRQVKLEASLLAKYIESLHPGERLFRPIHKMVLAVGEDEIKELKKHYEGIKNLFPQAKLIDRESIAKIEPRVIEGRSENEDVLALHNPHGHSVDYGKVAQSFIKNADHESKNISVNYNTPAKNIRKTDDGYILDCGSEEMCRAKTVLVATGGMSLTFAYELGYGQDWILLPVAGNFICSKKQVSGKVYMMQSKEIPFAAVHADPLVNDTNVTAYGPLAKVLPMLERKKYSSVRDFFRLFRFRWDAIVAILAVISQKVYLIYILKQFLFDIPVLGKLVFLRMEARKITPQIKYKDLIRGRKNAGIRPQVLNVKTRKLEMGEAKIEGDNIIFDITPSPGASVSLYNGFLNAKKLVDFLGDKKFDENRFRKDFELE